MTTSIIITTTNTYYSFSTSTYTNRIIPVPLSAPPLINTTNTITTITNRPGTQQYNFTTVESSEGGPGANEGSEGVWSTSITHLDPHTDYQVVVKAFNTEGAGPLTPPAAVTTREDGK